MKKLIPIGFLMLLIIAISKREQVEDAVAYLLSRIADFGNMLVSLVIRSDSAGDGHYDPVLEGGPRPSKVHNGVDLVATPGEEVFSPINAYIERVAYPYANSRDFRGLVLRGQGDLQPLEIKMFYVDPMATLIGTNVIKGQPIAYAQKISDRYPNQGMTDHVHVEYRWNNELIDPTPFVLGGVPI